MITVVNDPNNDHDGTDNEVDDGKAAAADQKPLGVKSVEFHIRYDDTMKQRSENVRSCDKECSVQDPAYVSPKRGSSVIVVHEKCFSFKHIVFFV